MCVVWNSQGGNLVVERGLNLGIMNFVKYFVCCKGGDLMFAQLIIANDEV